MIHRDSMSFCELIPDMADGTLLVISDGNPWLRIFLRTHPDSRLRLWVDRRGREQVGFAPTDAKRFLQFLTWRGKRARSGESLVRRYVRQRRR